MSKSIATMSMWERSESDDDSDEASSFCMHRRHGGLQCRHERKRHMNSACSSGIVPKKKLFQESPAQEGIPLPSAQDEGQPGPSGSSLLMNTSVQQQDTLVQPKEEEGESSDAKDMRVEVAEKRDVHVPGVKDWLKNFLTWSESERGEALNQLVWRCDSPQILELEKLVQPLLKRDFISCLPRELALHILRFLHPETLLKAAQVSRQWKSLADDVVLWREHCQRFGLCSEPRQNQKDPRWPPATNYWKQWYLYESMMQQSWASRQPRSTFTLTAHEGHYVTCLLFHEDKIVSGSDDATLKVWCAESGACLQTLIGHTGGVWVAEMQGNMIVSGSTDRTVRVWDIITGTCVAILQGHLSAVRCLHLVGDKVVSGSRDTTLRLWSVPDGECLSVLLGHSAAVRCVCYNGNLIVSGSYDTLVKIWDPFTGECIRTLIGHSNRVYTLQFDGVSIISGSLDATIKVWDVVTGTLRFTLNGHTSLVTGLQLHPRGQLLLSSSADCTARLWDIHAGRCLVLMAGPHKHQQAITGAQLHGRFIITSSDDGKVKIWDMLTGLFIRDLVCLPMSGFGGVVWRVRASRTRLVAAAGSRNGVEETKLVILDYEIGNRRVDMGIW